VVSVRVGMRLLVGRSRVGLHIGRFGELVFEKHHICRERPTGTEPDPCFGHVRVGIEPLVNGIAVVVDHRVRRAEHVVLDSFQVVASEVGTVRARVVCQVLRHLIDIAVIGAEPGVGVLGPVECGRVVTRADGSTRQRVVGRGFAVCRLV